MSRVADYSIVQDDALTVVSLSYQRKFNVPPNLHTKSSCVLSFVINKVIAIVGDGGSLTIKINGQSVYDAKYVGNTFDDRGLQEVFGKDVLKIGENTMEFIGNFASAAGYQGSITIQDVVVWFQVDSNVIGGSNALGDIRNGFLVLRKDDDKDRIRLDAKFADLRMGGEGTNGDILLFPSNIDTGNLDQALFATIHLSAKDATLRMGVPDLPGENGEKAGKILLRGGGASGSTRIRLDASKADLRMGGSGADGDILLFPANVDSESGPTEAFIHLDAGSGGSLSGGRITLRGGSDEGTRIRLNAAVADVRVGGNGRGGDVFLFPGTAGQQNAQATIRLDGETGDVRAGNFIAGGTTLNVPDYVWDGNYALMPLEELRSYTTREKRLPNIPSAATIRREGLNLSQFQLQLLEKVEELTRYLLIQQEAIQLQQARVDELESQLQGLTHNQR